MPQPQPPVIKRAKPFMSKWNFLHSMEVGEVAFLQEGYCTVASARTNAAGVGGGKKFRVEARKDELIKIYRTT